MPLVVWSYSPTLPNVGAVPAIREEDREFAKRLGRYLRQLRERVGWTLEDAAEALNVSLTSLGRWERGTHAPKGYDLGRLFHGYVKAGAGAEWKWFFDPPALPVVVDPIATRLDELERDGTISADLREKRLAERRQRAVAKRAVARGKRSRGNPPQ